MSLWRTIFCSLGGILWIAHEHTAQIKVAHLKYIKACRTSLEQNILGVRWPYVRQLMVRLINRNCNTFKSKTKLRRKNFKSGEEKRGYSFAFFGSFLSKKIYKLWFFENYLTCQCTSYLLPCKRRVGVHRDESLLLWSHWNQG